MIKIDISCEKIIELYSDMVYRIAVSQVKNPEDANDVFQDVFMQLIKNINSIKNEKHLKYWLIRTTMNRCKNHFNSFWRIKVDLYNDNSFQKDEHIQINEVRTMVLSLPQKFRDTVYLHYYEGYDVNEVAEILKIKVGTVKSRLHKARALLKSELKEESTV